MFTISVPFSYDLTKACNDIGLGKLHVPEIMGDIKIDPVTTEGAYEVKLESKRAQSDRILQLLRRYKGRKAFAPTESK